MGALCGKKMPGVGKAVDYVRRTCELSSGCANAMRWLAMLRTELGEYDGVKGVRSKVGQIVCRLEVLGAWVGGVEGRGCLGRGTSR